MRKTKKQKRLSRNSALLKLLCDKDGSSNQSGGKYKNINK